MRPVQPGSDESSVADEAVAAAGKWLVSLCGQNDYTNTTRSLTRLEQAKFDEFFVLYGHSPVFKPCHVEAVRKCLSKRWKPDYRLARSLLEKDDTRLLFADEIDVLQVAIRAAQIDPGLLGKSPKESCPELLSMVELLISHGASPSCLDGDGNSALFYACVLGYSELFHFLIAGGADISTLHKRSRPEQLGEPDDSPDQEEDTKVNLLQVTLDALISPQNIIDFTWVGWPPGVSYDRAMWELDLESTWGGIIPHLLKQGLEHCNDDPGLVMILHIACYEGELHFVEQLLGFGVDTNAAGPRMVDGGQGKGNSFGTALHAAAANRQLSIANLLMAHGSSPRARAPCLTTYDRTTQDFTPAEVAISLSRYTDDDMGTLLGFLEALMQRDEGLDESDHQTIMEFCARQNNIDFAMNLVQRGVQPQQVPADVGSLEMAQLLISHGASIDPAAVQKKALQRQNLKLLRWCVSEYGPQLASDPESWGNMALRMMKGGAIYLTTIKYLISEYPGPHIDAVLVAKWRHANNDTVSGPTSWLHMAAIRDNVGALKLLLEAGADPTCPGLGGGASAAIRLSGRYLFHDIPERLKVIQMLEGHGRDDGDWVPPSYVELKTWLVDTIASQKTAWDKRLRTLLESRQELPLPTQQSQASVSTASTHIASSKFTYPPLRSKSAIRLLELLPSSNRADPLAGRLVESDLTLQPEYEALSYVWGNTDARKDMSLDDQAALIAPNLHSALVHLRHSKDIQTLWVDALCIDQSTHAERNQQVTIMGDIYKSARQVVVWLGEAADDSHLVFAYLKDDKIPKSIVNRPEPPEPQRRAWRALVRRPWFFRTWVIQEVALSRKAVVMCGEDSAPWMDLKSGARADISGGAGGLSSVSSAPGNKSDHPFAGFDADNHVWRLRLLKPRSSHPTEVIQYSRACQSTEVRDKVYGILGLFEPSFMTVDYDLPVDEIFRQFTEAAIQLSGDLSILKLSGLRPRFGSLPSWVPDFTDTITVGTLPRRRWYSSYQFGTKDSYAFRTADGTQSSVDRRELTEKILPGLTFSPGGVLVVRGKIVGTIRGLGPELTSGTACAPGTSAFARVMEAWETLATTLIPGWDLSLASSVTKAFAATLVASDGNELHDIYIGFTEWYRHNGSGILEAEDPAMFVRELEYYLWYLGVGKDDDKEDQEELTHELRSFAVNMEPVCYGRRFFTTKGGSMGLAGPRARVGDTIVYLPGGDQAFVLRRRDDGTGWTMANDCYLYGLSPYKVFEDEEHVVDEFVVF